MVRRFTYAHLLHFRFILVGAFVAVPNKPRIARFLIRNWWIVTFLMVKILTAGAFHQLVAALLKSHIFKQFLDKLNTNDKA